MKKYIQFIISSLLLFQLSSCDILDRYPLDAPSDATFLATEAELTAAVAACYQVMWQAIDEAPVLMCLDQVSDIGWNRNVHAMQQVGSNSYDATNGMITSIWTWFYSAIAKCNYVLANMHHGENVIQSSVFLRYKAEVQFLRVLYYSYLIELWGDVPLITEPLTLSTGQSYKSHKADIVRFLLQELDEAAPNLLDANITLPTNGRPTNGAALALKSRIALYNELWNEAIDAAEKVMDMENAPYILDGNFKTLFQYAGMNSKEIIFSTQYLKGVSPNQPLVRLFGPRNAMCHTNKKPAYQMADAWECIDGLSIDKSPLFNPKDPFTNRDPRLGYTLAVPGSIFVGFQFETHGDSLQCWNYNTSPPRRISNEEAIHAYASFTGICWRKYVDSLDLPDLFGDLNIILLRYAEVLLNYAEAKIEKGDITDGKALAAINKIRARKSVEMPPVVATTQVELRNAVRRERKYELSCEGFRLFDIRRWRIAEVVMNENFLGRMKKDYPDKAPRIDEMANAFYDNGIPIADQGQSADHMMRVVEVRKNTFRQEHYLWPIPSVERETNLNIDKYVE